MKSRYYYELPEDMYYSLKNYAEICIPALCFKIIKHTILNFQVGKVRKVGEKSNSLKKRWDNRISSFFGRGLGSGGILFSCYLPPRMTSLHITFLRYFLNKNSSLFPQRTYLLEFKLLTKVCLFKK